MPHPKNRDPAYVHGHDEIDRQHRILLEQCNHLGDACADPAAFDVALAQMKTLAEGHFRFESEVLPDAAEDLQAEREEFDHLLAQVATTELFDRVEVQRFVTLWWTGHVHGIAERRRASGG